MTTPLRPDGLPEPTDAFESAVVDLLVDLFTAYPTWGTDAGYHVVDDRWPDLSEDGRQARLRMLRGHVDRLEAFDADALSPDQRVDRHVLLEEIEKAIFGEEVLRGEAWDALELVYLMGSGLFGLLSREYAPWSQRGEALLSRLRGLPELSRQALAGLTGLPDRPVALLQLDTALAQLEGVTELVDASLAEATLHAPRPVRPPTWSAPWRPQPGMPATRWMPSAPDSTATSAPAPPGRAAWVRSSSPASCASPSAATSRPTSCAAVPGPTTTPCAREMLRLARETWPTWLPGEPLPDVAEGDADGEAALVKRVLDAIAAEHQQPEGLIAYCQAEIDRIVAFCREHDVISLPDEPLTITWTPLFLRAHARAFLDSPGPLDRGQRSHFWITPPDESLGPEAVESYLREENDRMLRDLSIHEAIPGHYLQLAASNRCPSLARTVFTNGMFAEGWAVYVTQVMVDLGYGADDPGFALTHWKLYLRAVVNAILDVETHAGSMTEAEALDLMVRGAWQEPDEARGKWLRARISSTQLSTYYVGSLEMWDLEVEVRRRAAEAAGRRRRCRATAARGGRPRRDAGLRPAHPPRGRHQPRHAAHQVVSPHPARRGGVSEPRQAPRRARRHPVSELRPARRCGALTRHGRARDPCPRSSRPRRRSWWPSSATS